MVHLRVVGVCFTQVCGRKQTVSATRMRFKGEQREMATPASCAQQSAPLITAWFAVKAGSVLKPEKARQVPSIKYYPKIPQDSPHTKYSLRQPVTTILRESSLERNNNFGQENGQKFRQA